MISFIAGLMIAITSVSYSYNPVDFYEEDGYLKPTGKFHGISNQLVNFMAMQ